MSAVKVLEHTLNWPPQLHISYNLWYDHCALLEEASREDTCRNPTFFNAKCRLYRNRVLKVVRLKLDMVEELMDDQK